MYRLLNRSQMADTCFSTAAELKRVVQEIYSLEHMLQNLNGTHTYNKTNLTEVIAENTEKNKIATIIEILKSFDVAKIKTSGTITVCPITHELITSLETYYSQLISTRRYDDDAQRFLDETANEIYSTQSKLDEARAKLNYISIVYNREKDALLKRLNETTELLNECFAERSHCDTIACIANNCSLNASAHDKL